MSQHDEAIAALLGTDLTNVQIGRKVGVNESTVRRARARLAKAGDAVAAPASKGAKMDLDTGTGEGEFHNVTTDQPMTDWSHVFEKFGLDPSEFVIADDTVRMSVWQQSKRLENGDRDVQNLYSYRARFRRATEMDNLNLPALYAATEHVDPPAPHHGPERVTVVVWADPQIGKTGSRGTTKDLLRRSLLKRADLGRLLELRKPSATILLDGGDGIEGFESGGNPMFTNDLSLSGQLDLYGTELMEWIKTLHKHAPVTVASVPSNHAAWRSGKQNLGNPGDDLGLFMHKQVRKVATAAGMAVTWQAPAKHDETVAVDALGTIIGLVHGNQFGPGQAIAWWEKQTFGAQAVAGADVLVTGHYHSFGAGVAGRNPVSKKQRWWLGAPTLDNGSDWYRTTSGRDSDPGVLVFDVTPDGFDLASLTIL